MRLPRVRFPTRPPIGTATTGRRSESLRKSIVILVVMLGAVSVCAVIGRRPMARLPVPVIRAAATTGTPICHGTIVSIEIDGTALPDKLRRDNSLWVVTVRPDAEPSGEAPGRVMRFSMHSPSMNGFRSVGERVEVYEDDRWGVWAIPYASGIERVTVPR
jgi:hypothetical protein